jgi:hypothetical protein
MTQDVFGQLNDEVLVGPFWDDLASVEVEMSKFSPVEHLLDEYFLCRIDRILSSIGTLVTIEQ